MRFALKILISVLVLTTMSASLFAETILDTGPIDGGQELGFSPRTWHARQFELTEATEITSLLGFMIESDDAPEEDAFAAIYTNGDNQLPNTEIFSMPFEIPNNNSAGWYGVDEATWSLTAGTYWAVFGVDSASEFEGLMPFDRSGGELFAARVDPSVPGEPPIEPRWILSVEPNRNLGFRISGEQIPEPTNSGLSVICMVIAYFKMRSRDR